MKIDNTCVILSSKDIDLKLTRLTKKVGGLNRFKSRYLGSKVGWESGITFIRDSFLVDHAKSLASEQIVLSSCPANCENWEKNVLSSWPINCVDWEKAADELRKSYESIIFDGVQYWFVGE